MTLVTGEYTIFSAFSDKVTSEIAEIPDKLTVVTVIPQVLSKTASIPLAIFERYAR
ncbi:MAG: hypothetical protein ACTSYL_03165 [Candidatus Thorarchaeota archaeon]